jgi:hypothetical protein
MVHTCSQHVGGGVAGGVAVRDITSRNTVTFPVVYRAQTVVCSFHGQNMGPKSRKRESAFNRSSYTCQRVISPRIRKPIWARGSQRVSTEWPSYLWVRNHPCGEGYSDRTRCTTADLSTRTFPPNPNLQRLGPWISLLCLKIVFLDQ